MSAWGRSSESPRIRCGAKTRSGASCSNWAMPNGRCRMHGGASPGAQPGNRNAWKHGAFSPEIQAMRELVRTCEMRLESIASRSLGGSGESVPNCAGEASIFAGGGIPDGTRFLIRGFSDIARLLTDEDAARQLLADLRWPNGVTCPNSDCAADKAVYELARSNARREWKCGACRRRFSVATGLFLEGAQMPLGKWLYAIFLTGISKRRVGAKCLAGELGITRKTARSVCRKIRAEMRRQNINPGECPDLSWIARATNFSGAPGAPAVRTKASCPPLSAIRPSTPGGRSASRAAS